MQNTSQNRLPRAILFDHDGVLVASEPLHWLAWEKLLDDLRIPYNAAEFRTLVGKTAPEILIDLLNRFKPGWNPAEFDVVELARRKNDIYLQQIPTSLKAYDGVIDGLKWLRAQGVKTAAVSNAKRRELESALTLLGITPLLDLIVSRDDVNAAKPDPTPYLFAAGALGCDVSECIAVEDSPTGIEASLIAKIPSAAVLTNFSRAALEHPVPGRPDLKPGWIGASMLEFFEWLGMPRA